MVKTTVAESWLVPNTSLIVIEKVAEEFPAELLAVTVKVSAANAPIGVPEIEPVLVSNCKPPIDEKVKDEGDDTLIVNVSAEPPVFEIE